MSKFQALVCKYAPWMLVALLCLGLQPSVLGQATSASLTVSIADTTGALIPNVEVVIRNVETNQEQRTNSGTSGSSTFSFLKPGRYALTISKQDFTEVAVNNIALNVGDEKHL